MSTESELLASIEDVKQEMSQLKDYMDNLSKHDYEEYNGALARYEELKNEYKKLTN